jgi:hypothetical protein
MAINLIQSQPTNPVLCSQVTSEPLGPLVLGSLLVGSGMLALPVGAALWSSARLAGGLTGLAGVGLLAVAWHLAKRDTAPLLLTLSPEALRLTTLSQHPSQGRAIETIPLASLVAYTHWLSRGRVFTRYYVRLELADGRVIRLADPPGVLPSPGKQVLLSELVAQLAQWAGPGTLVRPPFAQTAAARWLMYLSWLILVIALGLLWNGYLGVGGLLFTFTGAYLLSFYRMRQLDKIGVGMLR